MADEKDSNILTLSEALLAPLNSIFEAQIHAARAFLSFLLQMGFRHRYTEEDIAYLKANDNDENKSILKKIDEEKEDQKTIDRLKERLRELESLESPTSGEQREVANIRARLKELNIKWSPLYNQLIDYVDQDGIDRRLIIPNLSLLPIKPLGIHEANFKYELRVTDSVKTEPVIKTAGANPKRPWFLVDPKTIEGEFATAPRREDSTDKSIKIEITVGTMDMPYGLHKLISSLTGTAQDLERSTGPETK
jgi:hypothetical protein